MIGSDAISKHPIPELKSDGNCLIEEKIDYKIFAPTTDN
jgi:hypothetical protein